MDGIGEVRRCKFKMGGKRRQKGERLIIAKEWVELTSKGGVVFKRKAKVQNRRHKFLKVGHKCSRDRQRKRGPHDSRRRAEDRRGGVEEKLR